PSHIVGANQANETVLATGSLRFEPGGGSGTLVSAQGNNVVTAPDVGGGNWELHFDSGNNTVIASSGNYFIETDTEFTFGQNRIVLGTGDDTVLSWGADTITGGTGQDLIVLRHAGAQVQGGGGPSTIVDIGDHATVTQGAGQETVFAASTGSRFNGSNASLLF